MLFLILFNKNTQKFYTLKEICTSQPHRMATAKHLRAPIFPAPTAHQFGRQEFQSLRIVVIVLFIVVENRSSSRIDVGAIIILVVVLVRAANRHFVKAKCIAELVFGGGLFWNRIKVHVFVVVVVVATRMFIVAMVKILITIRL